jgi:hypothetical protein
MTSVYGYVQANDYTYKYSEIKKEWVPSQGSIADILSDHLFMNIIRQAGYELMFGTNENFFTVFVPNIVPQMDLTNARDIVRYSTLPTKADMYVISQKTFVVPMLTGNRIRVTKSNNKLFLNNSRVIRPNVIATNGIIHFIDVPLEPPFSS